MAIRIVKQSKEPKPIISNLIIIPINRPPSIAKLVDNAVDEAISGVTANINTLVDEAISGTTENINLLVDDALDDALSGVTGTINTLIGNVISGITSAENIRIQNEIDRNEKWSKTIISDGTVTDIVVKTQEAFDAIVTKDPTTLYIIKTN